MRPQRGAPDFAPSLYQARRPSTSPTKILRPQRPHQPGGVGTAAPVAATFTKKCTSSASDRAPADRTAAAVTAPATTGGGFLPYAPSAYAGTVVRRTLERSGSLFSRSGRADGESSPHPHGFSSLSVSPSPSAAPVTTNRGPLSNVAVLLQQVLSMPEPTLSVFDVVCARRALETASSGPSWRKGIRPGPPLSRSAQVPLARSDDGQSAADGTPSLLPAQEEATVRALVAACEAPTDKAAMDVLAAAYHSAGSPNAPPALPTTASTAAASSSSCLVAVTLVELRFQLHCATPGDLPLLEAALQDGHPAAALRVGLCLRDGALGLPVDLPAALTYIEAAAVAGYPPAMHELGTLYESGCGAGGVRLDADWGEALRWYERAAAAGCTSSKLNLGKLLALAGSAGPLAATVASAEELEQLRSRSKGWLEQAAVEGSEEAVRLLRRL